MVIRRSARSDIPRLLADLTAPGPEAESRRASAAARLALLGTRAVRHLVHAWPTAGTPEARVAILRLLESTADRRTTETAAAALADEHPGVRAAAEALATRLLDSAGDTVMLDRLSAIAVDAAAPLRARTAAARVLLTLPADAVAPLGDRLPGGSSGEAHGRGSPPPAGEPGEASTIEHLVRDGTGVDPGRLLEAVSRERAMAPLSTLHAAIEASRRAESREADAATRRDWQAVRGALHLALAARDSRVAVYDLRETLEGASGVLPIDFAEAARRVGDASCLEGLASAWSRTLPDTEEARAWQTAVGQAFQAVAARTRTGARSAAARRLVARHGQALRQLWAASTPSRTAPSSRKAVRT